MSDSLPEDPDLVESILFQQFPHIAEWTVAERERFVTFMSSLAMDLNAAVAAWDELPHEVWD
jgi:hypothetical protein